MISKKKTLSIDDKVWRCIRRHKRFVFSDVLLITGATKDYLEDLIEGYECEGIIKLKDPSKPLSEREYTVLKKMQLNVGVVYRASSMKYENVFSKVVKALKNHNMEMITFNELSHKGFLRGSLKVIISKLILLDVIKEIENPSKDTNLAYNATFSIDSLNLEKIEKLCNSRSTKTLKKLIEQRKESLVVVPAKVTKKTPQEIGAIYMSTDQYRQRLRVLKAIDKQISRAKMIELSKVSKTSIRLILTKEHPNPQKMIERIVTNLGIDKEKLSKVHTGHEVKHFARDFKCNL